ncbi:hypothetical protein PG994_003219 [Apiospora phragmitis]|uniref:Alcohol acetyltransferase n=1 Tax=Apiospora phragmitis TaxID=2905665 RepID=A0ABR1VXH7_9PEZI
MSQENVFLRYASNNPGPCERRMISREDLGFYCNIVVGATYEFGQRGAKEADLQSLQTFAGPLKHCIEKFPYLKIVTRDASTEKPFFERVTSLNLTNHLTVVERPIATNPDDGDDKWMEPLLESLVDKPNSIASIPPWRVVVCPIALARCFVAFAYSHIVGDGPAALAFHRAFLDGLRRQQRQQTTGLQEVVEEKTLLTVPEFALPDPFDVPGRLPISWSFLLGPLLAVLLPKFVAGWLGLQAHAAKIDEGTWTGSDVFFEPGTQRSRVKAFAIDDARVSNFIKASRAHDAKLTGTMHQLVVRALSKHIITHDKATTTTNFTSQTAISMRASIGVPREEWGNYASGCYGVHPIEKEATKGLLPARMWENASSLSNTIAESAVQLRDQPLGLLRYAPSIRNWMLGKVGGRRDCSYEVSNLTSFDGEVSGSCCNITNMVFAQPGGVVSAPLAFNLVSVRGGPLLGTITWGQGALGVPVEAEEALVEGIRRSLVEDFAGIGS